jgi:hypothetical protein
MRGRAVSNSYAGPTILECERCATAANSVSEQASAMATMTYSEKLISTAPSAPAKRAAFEPAAASFQRPGPDVLNETIPVVFIGRDRNGLWVVRDAEARFGGLFWRERSALAFARANAAPNPCAIVFPQARFELDMQNHGNPLLTPLAAAIGLLTRQSQRLIAAGRKHFAL